MSKIYHTVYTDEKNDNNGKINDQFIWPTDNFCQLSHNIIMILYYMPVATKKQEAQLSPRDPRDALYQSKCCSILLYK